MRRRILLADDSEAVVTAIRRDLEERGRQVEAVSPAEAAARVSPGRHGAALVRGTAGPQVVAAIRAVDPLLPVILLFLDRKEAAAHPGARGDAVLVGPLTASAVTTACTLAEQLRARAERIAELEARLARPARMGRDLEFLKKLLFVEVKRSRRYGHPLSLALVAIDGWPAVATKLSARARTALLAELLGVVSASLRDIDLAVPFADERFVLLMPHTQAEGALRVARRVCALVRDRPGTPRVTASVGVAAHGGDRAVSFGGLVKRASEALARAQAGGGDRAEPADPPKKRDRISIG
jgi:diguanylate cyclase (GGDEF)-like protein